MADYGLKVKNNSGEIQIDSTYRNLSLDESGSGVTISNDNSEGGFYTRVTLVSSPLAALILVRPNTDDFVAVKSYYKSGSDFAGVDLVTMQQQSTIVDWKSYRENRVVSGDNYGLLVYNSAGELCFDSGKSYFKIHSVHSITLANPTNQEADLGPYEDISHAGISNPYYILSPASYWLKYNPPAQSSSIRAWLIGMKKLTSTSVRIGWFAHFGGPSPQNDNVSEGYNPTMKLIVCDVT